jgi:hypothetical protein
MPRGHGIGAVLRDGPHHLSLYFSWKLPPVFLRYLTRGFQGVCLTAGWLCRPAPLSTLSPASQTMKKTSFILSIPVLSYQMLMSISRLEFRADACPTGRVAASLLSLILHPCRVYVDRPGR